MELQQALDELTEQLRSLKQEGEESTAKDNCRTKSYSTLSAVEPFTGARGENVEGFLSCLERAGKFGGWSDEDLLGALVLKLRAGAAGFMQAHEKAGDVTSYAVAKDLLLKRYGGVENRRYYRELLANVRIGPGEEIEEFADRIRSINMHTIKAEENPGKAAVRRAEADERALDAFLNGLVGRIGEHTRLAMPESLDAAVAAAVRVREVERRARTVSEPRKVFVSAAGGCYTCGQNGHFARECPRGQGALKCYNCGGAGHRARECRQPGRVMVQGVQRDLNDEGVQRAAR
jgi:hypothetical protein